MTLQTDLLKGKKVYLAASKKEDGPTFVKFGKNMDYVRLLSTGLYRPFTIEQAEEWYDESRKDDTFIPFNIRTLENDQHEEGELIGFINAMGINWQARNCWIGIGIGNPDYWGKGYGSDAMRILLRYGFMEMNMNRMSLIVSEYNPRAIKSYEKVGFSHEGIQRQALWRDGKFFDIHHMAILREGWINDTTN